MTAVPFRGAGTGARVGLWILAAPGTAAVIAAAREHAWSIGHWSQDLSPLPLLAGIALLSTALDKLGFLGGADDKGAFSADMRPWHLAGMGLTAAGLALLGRSGLALLLAAAMAAALVLVHLIESRRDRG